MLNMVDQKPKTRKRKAGMPVVKMIEYNLFYCGRGQKNLSSQAESGELSTSNAIMSSPALLHWSHRFKWLSF
jgi:hypothetical protein